MNEVMMVPVQEFNQLQDYYKEKLTENALLNKAGRLAAEEHLISNDPNIPASMAVKMVKPIASEEGKLVKHLRTGTSGPIAYQGTEEPEGMADAPVDNLLKKFLKGVNKDPAAPIIIKEEPSSSKKKSVKKKVMSPKGPILIKPSTRKKVTPSTRKKAAAATPSTSKSRYSEASQRVLKIMGLADEEDGGYSPKDVKGKKPKKAKKTALQKLQEGWEDWDYLFR